MLPKRFGRKKDNYAVYIIGYHRLYPKKFQFPCDNTIHQAKIQTFVKPLPPTHYFEFETVFIQNKFHK